jgi:hypothetical protein
LPVSRKEPEYAFEKEAKAYTYCKHARERFWTG